MLGLGLGLRSMGQSLQQKAMSILRSFGSNASSYPFATLQGAYQTSAGPAALVVTDPIGLELDALGVVGSELVTNGDFSDGSTGWNLSAQWSVSAGAAHRSGVGWGTLTRPGTCSAGKMYKIEGDVVYTSGLLQIYGCEGDQVLIQDGGHFVGWMTAGAIGGNFNIGSSDFVGSVTNISVREVTGNHATQTTAINRPLLQQDGGGRWYAQFNGTNSSMQLASVPFQMTDDHCVVACFSLSSDTINQGVFYGGAGTGWIASIYADTANGVRIWYWNNASGSFSLVVGSIALNDVVVVSLRCASGIVTGRKNGVVAGTITPTGAFTVTTSGIGTHPSLVSMAGGIYDLQVIKGTVTDAQLLTLEKAAGQRGGLVL